MRRLKNPIITYQSNDVWMLLSMSLCRKEATVDEIIGVADMINHAIPPEDVITEGFTRLLQGGLVYLNERRIGLTRKGKLLTGLVRKNTTAFMKQWTLLLERLLARKYRKENDFTFSFEPGEYARACQTYIDRFWDQRKSPAE